ncbi:MAG: hypothetical protein U0324_43380 [Polyangiales bacterium]
MKQSRKQSTRWMAVMAMGAALAGCQDAAGGFENVQRVVGRGAQAALSARPTVTADDEVRAGQAVPEARADDATPVEQVPSPVFLPDGSMRFVPDANHQEISGARGRDGVAVTWTDGAHHAVYLGLLDPQGRARGAGSQIHVAVPDEEGVSSPAVAAAHEGYGVAWADRENGRVRFARLDARGALRGRVAIVHDGVDAPRSARIVWSGREFGVAVGLRRGVYFARVGDNGARLGEPVVLSEGESVSSIDAVEWDGRAFGVSITVTGAQRVEQIRHRVARTDRHA